MDSTKISIENDHRDLLPADESLSEGSPSCTTNQPSAVGDGEAKATTVQRPNLLQKGGRPRSSRRSEDPDLDILNSDSMFDSTSSLQSMNSSKTSNSNSNSNPNSNLSFNINGRMVSSERGNRKFARVNTGAATSSSEKSSALEQLEAEELLVEGVAGAGSSIIGGTCSSGSTRPAFGKSRSGMSDEMALEIGELLLNPDDDDDNDANNELIMASYSSHEGDRARDVPCTDFSLLLQKQQLQRPVMETIGSTNSNLSVFDLLDDEDGEETDALVIASMPTSRPTSRPVSAATSRVGTRNPSPNISEDEGEDERSETGDKSLLLNVDGEEFGFKDTDSDSVFEKKREQVFICSAAALTASCGKYSCKEPAYQRRFDRSNKLLGSAHPKTLRALNNLAFVYLSTGCPERAQSLFQECFELESFALGTDHMGTIIAMNNLAFTHEALGKNDLALPLYEESHSKLLEVLGEKHRLTLESAANLVYLYDSFGRYADMEPLLLRCLQGAKTALGDSHQETLSHQDNLAFLYDSQGRYRAAQILHLDTLCNRRQALGDVHEQTINSLHLLFYAHEKMRAVLGENHPDTVKALEDIAEVRRTLKTAATPEERSVEDIAEEAEYLESYWKTSSSSKDNAHGAAAAAGGTTSAAAAVNKQEGLEPVPVVQRTQKKKPQHLSSGEGSSVGSSSMRKKKVAAKPVAGCCVVQ